MQKIRKLAESSMEATKKIAGIIKQRQKTAIAATEETYREGKGGITLAEDRGSVFTGIITSMEESSDVIRAVARSAAELNKAIEQVMKYVTEMNMSAKEVAGAVEGQVKGAGAIRVSLDRMNKMVREVNIGASFKVSSN